MKKYLILSVCLLIGSMCLAQTTTYTDRATFEGALDPSTIPTPQSFEVAPVGTYAGFSTASSFHVHSTKCATDGTQSLGWFTDLTITLDQPGNFLGFDILDAGERGQVTITLMDDNGTMETIVQDYGGAVCNQLFFGITSTIDFTTVMFSSNIPNDGILFDQLIQGNDPALAVLVPTMSQWAVFNLGMLLASLGLIAIKKRSINIA